MAITYHKDKVIKLQYNPTDIYTIKNLNIVGASKETTDRLDFTPNDTNSIFVTKQGNNNNQGTASQPVLTIEKAIQLCDSNKRNIVINDDGVYEEANLNLNQYIDRIVANYGYAPEIKPINNTSAQHIEDLNVLIGATKLDKSLAGYTIQKVLHTVENKLIFLLSTFSIPSGTFGTLSFYYYVYDLDTNTTKIDITYLGNSDSGGVNMDIDVLDDGGFILVWSKQNDAYAEVWGQVRYGAKYNYAIRINTKRLRLVSITLPPTKTVSILPWVCKMPNGNYGIFFLTYSGWYNIGELFQCDENLNYLSGTNATVFSYSNDTNSYRLYIKSFNNNRLFLAGNRGSTAYYAIYNNNSAVISWTSIGSYTINDIAIVQNNIAIAYSTGNNRYFTLFNASGSTLATTNYSTQDMNGISIVDDGSGGFNIIGKHAAITQFIFNRFSASDGSRLANETVHTYSTMLNITGIKFIKDVNGTKGEAYYIGYSGNDYYYLKYTNYLYDGIIITKNIEFNGVKITGSEYNLKYLLRGSGDITFKYCDVQAKKEGLYDANKIIASIIGGVSIYNSKIYYSDEGITCTKANNIICEYSVFYYVMYNYVLKLSSINTKTITINKCTFFNNYGGINIDTALISGEVKNSIFHNQSSHDILVNNNTGDVNVSYCCYTGAMSGLASITNSKTNNPLFVDEGVYNINNVDLHLKSVYGGYPVNSPAIGIADDIGDAGAYIASYIITEQTRDEIYLPKPLIQITYQPVNAIQTVSRTGKIYTKRDGLQKVYILTWKSMLIDDYNKLLDVIKCGKNSIYLYPDPISSNDFINCTLVFENLSGSPQYPVQFETGVYDCIIKLAHEVVD